MDKLHPPPQKKMLSKKSVAPYVDNGDLSSAQQNSKDTIAKTEEERESWRERASALTTLVVVSVCLCDQLRPPNANGNNIS